MSGEIDYQRRRQERGDCGEDGGGTEKRRRPLVAAGFEEVHEKDGGDNRGSGAIGEVGVEAESVGEAGEYDAAHVRLTGSRAADGIQQQPQTPGKKTGRGDGAESDA